MATFLFDDIIFGPVKSRRFGVSLGVNLLPESYKFCTFNCVYCECGWTYKNNAEKVKLPTREEIRDNLEIKLQQMVEEGVAPDNITFAGNGEPTVHPRFSKIIEDTIALRNFYFPDAEITVLSNSSMLHKKWVFDALSKVDNNVLKLDTAIEETFGLINIPTKGLSLKMIIEEIKKFNGDQIIQTLFIKGEHNGISFDNTSPEELNALLKVLKEIGPRYVMVYSIERDTALNSLEKISESKLRSIAKMINEHGIEAVVYS
ncbi:MAG: radical SAM protein [Bacteroidetes bacterium]|nr:MAG: radical SAM protein [Bacteroidota bacterium]